MSSFSRLHRPSWPWPGAGQTDLGLGPCSSALGIVEEQVLTLNRNWSLGMMGENDAAKPASNTHLLEAGGNAPTLLSPLPLPCQGHENCWLGQPGPLFLCVTSHLSSCSPALSCLQGSAMAEGSFGIPGRSWHVCAHGQHAVPGGQPLPPSPSSSAFQDHLSAASPLKESPDLPGRASDPTSYLCI